MIGQVACILLIDDSASVREVLRLALEAEGCEVPEAVCDRHGLVTGDGGE